MGTYYLPRNVKGENRILYIFTGKSLIYAVISGIVGLIFYFVFSILNMKIIGIIFALLFAIIGFAIGTLKMPELGKFEFSRKTGGENLDEIIKRAIKFKSKGKKIYIYKEGKNNE